AGMAEFAAALDAYLEREPRAAPTRQPRPGQVRSIRRASPLIRRDAIRFVFTGVGSTAPRGGPSPDRLYLDVGDDVRPGVLDHHHWESYGGSTTRLIASNPDLVTGVVQQPRDPTSSLTIVLHEAPDLDSVASAYLAIALLTTGEFLPGTEALVRYVD